MSVCNLWLQDVKTDPSVAYILPCIVVVSVSKPDMLLDHLGALHICLSI
jgi:hypothetical protein